MKKSKLILLILAVAAIVLAIGYFAVVRPIVNRTSTTPAEPVALLDGEAYFHLNGNESNQIPVLFPQIDRADLYEIRIENGGEYYGFTHYLSGGKDYFLMWTEDGEGERSLYLPEIARTSADFDYTTLYDETSKIPTLITGSGCVVFKERVYIRADADPAPSDEEYQTILHRYGLADADHPVGYEITPLMRDDRGNLMYTDGEGLFCTDGSRNNPRVYDAITLRNNGYDYEKTPTVDTTGMTFSVLPSADTIRVYVGDRTPDEKGYYLRLDGRDVVYTTGTNSIGRIVYQNLSYYIHPRLVQASENLNSSYALFTPSFRVFSGTGEKADGIAPSDVVLFSSSFAIRNGLSPDKTGALALGTGNLPKNLIDALVSSGASVGDTLPLLYGTTAETHLNLAPDKKTAYEIWSVYAVIRGGDYLGDGGTVVEAGDRVICVYTADGSEATGMIDLSTAPAALSDAIIGLAVGDAGKEPLVSATVDFTDAEIFETEVWQIESIQAYARNERFTAGLVVWNSSEKTSVQTAALPSTGAHGWVAVTYSVKRDGVLAVKRALLNLDGGNATYAEDRMAQAILSSDLPSGKLTLGYRQVPTTVSLPADPFASYLVYRDFKIEGIFGSDEVLGVSYVNETERNIFYGGSAYEITSPANRRIFSVNNDGLMNVLQNVFTEAKGSETVAVGLTKANFDKYGLGSHTVYFEMPVGMTYRDGTTMDVGISERVGFRLYISDRKSDAEGDYYYVASDLYGIVAKAKVSDCDLSFVDWSFGEKWVDDDLLLLDLTNIRDITFRINYSDLKETHGFAVSVNPNYHTTEDDSDVTKKIYVAYVPGAIPTYLKRVEESRKVEPDNRNYPARSASGSVYYRTYYGTQITQINDDFWSVRIVSNEGAIGLDDHYSNVRGGAELDFTGVYYEGVANFTKLITLIYTSKYSGTIDPATLSDAETARIGDLLAKDGEGNFVLSDDDEAAREKAVFTITLNLVDDREFRLTFYPVSDGRYLLSFADKAAKTVSREFYMNMGEIKNMVTAVRTIVAGGTVRYDESYLPEPN